MQGAAFPEAAKGCSAPRRGSLFQCVGADDSVRPEPLSFCLRRVTFFPWRKKVTKERHSRGKGFRFPFPLENPPSLKRPKGRGLRPPPLWKPPPLGWAIIKSRLCRKAAKVGGGQGPTFDNTFALGRGVVRLCISEQERQRKEKQRRCNI